MHELSESSCFSEDYLILQMKTLRDIEVYYLPNVEMESGRAFGILHSVLVKEIKKPPKILLLW